MPGLGENAREKEDQPDARAAQKTTAAASHQRQNQERADGPGRFVHGESEQPARENAQSDEDKR